MFEHPRKCTLGAFYRSEINKIDFHTQFWSRKYINYNEKIIHKQNLTMNITAKHNPPFNADSNKLSNLINLTPSIPPRICSGVCLTQNQI